MATNMTLQQIQANPFLNAIMAPYLEPGAQLQSTQAGIAQTQASTANTQAALPGVQATSTADQQRAAQVNFQIQAQQQLSASKNKQGYVAPNVYNSLQQKATALGIPTSSFDGAFENTYTDPNAPIGYNTATGRANEQALGEIKRNYQALVDQYNSIPANQKGLMGGYSVGQGGKSLATDVSGLPVVGGVLGETVNNLSTGLLKVVAPDAYSYEQARSAFAAQLKSIAGGGAGSGLRVTQNELNNWANLTPSVSNTNAQNAKNISIVDSELKSTFNVPQGLDPQYTGKTETQKNSNNGLIGPLASVLNPVSNVGQVTNNVLNNTGGNAQTAGNLGASAMNAAGQTANFIGQVPRLAVTAGEGVAGMYGVGALGKFLSGAPITSSDLGVGADVNGPTSSGINFDASGRQAFPQDILSPQNNPTIYNGAGNPVSSTTAEATNQNILQKILSSRLGKAALKYGGYAALFDELGRGSNQPTDYTQQP